MGAVGQLGGDGGRPLPPVGRQVELAHRDPGQLADGGAHQAGECADTEVDPVPRAYVHRAGGEQEQQRAGRLLPVRAVQGRGQCGHPGSDLQEPGGGVGPSSPGRESGDHDRGDVTVPGGDLVQHPADLVAVARCDAEGDGALLGESVSLADDDRAAVVEPQQREVAGLGEDQLDAVGGGPVGGLLQA